MPISSISPSAWQIDDYSMWKGLIPAIQAGMKLGSEPFDEAADLKLKRAAAKQKEAMANMPFGGQTLPGPAGQALAVESMRQMFGEDSPQYKMALDSFMLSQMSDQSRINYQNTLSQTMPVRSLTTPGKSIMEEYNVTQGLSPTGQQFGANIAPPQNLPLTDAKTKALQSALSGNSAPSSEDLKNQYDLYRQKQTTDVDTRKRNLYATNIEKTLGRIDPSDLTKYAGAIGGVEKIGEAGLAPFGKESKDYDKYAKSLKDVDLLTSQVRQFYGESIQPEMIERLQNLANPSNWKNNPELAQSQFNELKSVLQSEMKTYRDALQGTGVYRGQNSGITQGIQQGLGGNKPNIDQLMQAAQAAIARGQDPALVKQRMQQLMGGS